MFTSHSEAKFILDQVMYRKFFFETISFISKNKLHVIPYCVVLISAASLHIQTSFSFPFNWVAYKNNNATPQYKVFLFPFNFLSPDPNSSLETVGKGAIFNRAPGEPWGLGEQLDVIFCMENAI